MFALEACSISVLIILLLIIMEPLNCNPASYPPSLVLPFHLFHFFIYYQPILGLRQYTDSKRYQHFRAKDFHKINTKSTFRKQNLGGLATSGPHPDTCLCGGDF